MVDSGIHTWTSIKTANDTFLILQGEGKYNFAGQNVFHRTEYISFDNHQNMVRPIIHESCQQVVQHLNTGFIALLPSLSEVSTIFVSVIIQRIIPQ